MELETLVVVALLGAGACTSSDRGAGSAAGNGGAANDGASGAAASAGGHAGSSATMGGGAGSDGSAVTGGGGSSGAGGPAEGNAGAGGAEAGSGVAGDAGSGAGGGAGGSGEPPPSAPMSFAQTQEAIEAYASAHPGMDGDILVKTPQQLAADPEAQALLGVCGEGALPVIPRLAWEYGGGDHAWIDPDASALVYCVYMPTAPSSGHWSYDAAKDRVTADVFVLFPDENPCADRSGADQVAMCIGDPSNFEILVDTASLNDGHDAGLELSEASTDLNLILPDGTFVHLYSGA